MRNNLFRGVTTAMITPFQADGSVDYDGLRRNTRHQLENGVFGLLPLGTTGEAPTLTHAEKERVVRTVVEEARSQSDQATVMVGVGTYSTVTTIENARDALAWGADALLVVTPYYNKPTQEGIVAHFKAICEAVDLPVVVYNIKGRTGTNIETATLAKIFENRTVIGVKEASGDLAQMMDVIAQIPELAVYSGDDIFTFPLIGLGGQGVVSVVSNLLPSEVAGMVASALAGDWEKARQMHYHLMPIFKAAFIETNPGPIKYAMNRRGLAAGPLRLPLVEIRPASRQKLDAVLQSYS